MYRVQIRKAVPNYMSSLYRSLVWTLSEGVGVRCVESADQLPEVHVSTVPKLLGGEIRRPLGVFKNRTLLGAAAFGSNMGNIFKPVDPRSLTPALLFAFTVWPLYRLRPTAVERVVEGNTFNLHVYTALSEGEFDDYTTALRPMFASGALNAEDVWFDLNNGTLLSFDKWFMANAPTLIQNSYLAIL